MENKISKRVEMMRDLMIPLKTELLFENYINKVFIKINKALGFVMKNSKIFEKTETLKNSTVDALVLSQLELASIVWNPKTIFVC